MAGAARVLGCLVRGGELMSFEIEPDVASPSPAAEPSWTDLVRGIQAGDAARIQELYDLFCKGIRFQLYRQLGPQDLDDRVHDIFLIIMQSIQRGDLREPERLMGYIRTVVRRQVAAQIDLTVQARRNQTELDYGMALSDHRPSSERRLIQEQEQQVALRVLKSLHEREREVLVRFYLKEQKAEQICREMELTETQFRLTKSRAKARFSELARNRLSLRKTFQK
jgi:RNA polymerase sigma-70 factor (ECF subfamily)